MSGDTPISNENATAVGDANETLDHVYLVSYPKIVFLYPTVLTALFCGVFMWAKGGIPQEEIRVPVAGANALAGMREPVLIARASFSTQTDEAVTPSPETKTNEPESGIDSPATSDSPATETAQPSDPIDPNAPAPAPNAKVNEHTYHHVCARIFLVVIALNFVVMAFDFPRTTSLTWFFAIVALIIGIWFLLKLNPWLAPQIVNALLQIKPAANASFYLIFTGIILFLFVCVMVSRRFDYWEVKGNELLHHHGFLSNMERFSAPNLRIDKEINDVFEYLLLRSGRLIIHSSNDSRTIVLDNVIGINDKEERITKMLGALQVRVRTERE